MRKLFYPSSVVVIGVSTRPFNLGQVIVWNLFNFGFKGKIHLVGKESGSIMDHKIHGSLDEISEPIDLAIILTPAKTVPGLMEQCGRKGIPRVVIESGGFGEFSEQGRAMGDELKRIGEKYGIRFIGPNCIGIMNSETGLCTPFTPMPNPYRRGSVGIIAQSGGVALSVLFMCDSEALGYSKFTTIGNKIDIDENDILEYYIEDEETKVITMYLESIRDGRRLTSIARRSPKPIVVHKANIASLSGTIAHSHTQALANDDLVVDAALRQAGMVRFRDMLAYMDFVKILQLPRMKGRNLAIVSRSGGHAVIAADAAYTYGFQLPPFPQDFLEEIRKHLRADVIKLSNPLDLGDLFDFNVYVKIIERTIKENNVDGILFMHTYNPTFEGVASTKLLKSVAELCREQEKPVAVCVSTEQSEISRLHGEFAFPTFVSPERAIYALAESIKYYQRRLFMALHEQTAEPAPAAETQAIRDIIAKAHNEGRSPLLNESLDIVRSLGINVPEHKVVRNADQMHDQLQGLPGPYALKVISQAISHKSDVGGVVLGLADAAAVRNAFLEMKANMVKAAHENDMRALVQRMIRRKPATYELIIGGKRDPQFGPVVLLGHGGVFVEVFEKTSLRMAPIPPAEIDQMIDELPGSEIFRGVRGLPPIDREGLKDAILRIGYLMTNFPEIDQIDVNPVIVSSDGVVAVDARIFLASDSRQ